VTVNTAFSALTINGGAGATDTLSLNSTAGMSISVINVEAVNGYVGTANESVTILATAVANVVVDLSTGTDTVTVSHTFGGTITASNVDTVFGGSGADVVTGVVAIAVFDGGAGSDTYAFTTGDTSITLVNVETATGVTAVSESVTIGSGNTATLAATDVNTITGSTGNDVITDTVTLTSAEVVSVSLSDGNDTVTVSLDGNSLTSTVSIFGGNGNDTITMTDGVTASGYVHYLNGGVGADTITGGATGVDVIQISLANDLQSGTTFASADVISGFATATDKIDLTAATLQSADGSTYVLRTSSGTGLTNTDSGGYSVSSSAAASTFADLTGSNQSFNLLLVNDTVTGSFTDQTSIDAAVTLITGTIGASGSTAVGTKLVLVLNDGDSNNSAVFLYTEAGTTGIQSSELKLVGVVQGAGDLAASNFI